MAYELRHSGKGARHTKAARISDAELKELERLRMVVPPDEAGIDGKQWTWPGRRASVSDVLRLGLRAMIEKYPAEEVPAKGAGAKTARSEAKSRVRSTRARASRKRAG